VSAIASEVWQPITFLPWRVNGGISPLIRSWDELGTACQTIPTVREAVRWSLSTLQCQYGILRGFELKGNEPAEDVKKIFAMFLRERSIPFWARGTRPQLVVNGKCARTAAQMLTLCGNLHCRAQCHDMKDLAQCFRLLGSVNNFEAEAVIGRFWEFNLATYFGAENPNTGNDAFGYHFGFESSQVVYIDALFSDTLRGLKILDPTWRKWRQYSPAEFQAHCEALAIATKADECTCSRYDAGHGVTSLQYRLWWD
jgi:hypothetical protein